MDSNKKREHFLIFKFLVGFLGTVVFHIIFGIPLILNFLLRLVAKLTAKLKPELGKPLDFRDVGLWYDTSVQHHCTIVTAWLIKGSVSLPKLKQLYTKNVLETEINKDSNPRLRFPELQQYISLWLGFPFWKNDEHFNIDNHIKELNNVPKSWNGLETIYEMLACKPYAANSSPWEMYIVPNFETDKKHTLLIWRGQHAMVDMLSIGNLVINALCECPITIPQPRMLSSINKKTNWTFTKFVNFFTTIYDLGIIFTNNARYKNTRDVQGHGQVVIRCCAPISTNLIKHVAAKAGVRVPALLTTVILDSLAKFLKTSKSHLHGNYVMPIENHPGIFKNHANVSMIQLPIRFTDSLLTRLKKVDRELNELIYDPKNDILEYFGWIINTLMFPLPKWIVNNFGAYSLVAVTNLSVGRDQFSLEGAQCTAFSGITTFPAHLTGGIVSAFGYHDKIEIVCATNDAFISEKETEKWAEGVTIAWQDLVRQLGAGGLPPKLELDGNKL